MRSMNILPTISMNAIIRVSTMSSPSPASNQVVSTGPFENPSGWAACSISTSALPDPLPLPQPFRSSAHASRPACLPPLSLHPCFTAPWKIFNQHLSPMQPLLPRMYILTLRVQAVFVTTLHLPALTHHAHVAYSVIEEIVEGFSNRFRANADDATAIQISCKP